MPAKRRASPPHLVLPDSALKWKHLISLISLICGLIGGMAINAFTIAKNIASVEYVDKTATTLKTYTDEQVKQTRTDFQQQNQSLLASFDMKFQQLMDLNKATLEKANDHSDMNRKGVEAPMAGLTAEIQALKDAFRDFVRDMRANPRR
jgi:enoyl-[acyl-carrier-protein] reductase (NADH)